jgi:hypothetical protein
MRMIRPFAGVLLPMLVLSVPVTLAAPDDGYIWEYTSIMDMQGREMKLPPTQRCMPVEEPQRTPPTQGDCTMDKLETVGNTTRFEMSCGNPREMKGSGSSTVTETTIEGEYTMASEGQEMKMRVRGERLGPCDTSVPMPAMKGMPMMPGMPPGMAPPR